MVVERFPLLILVLSFFGLWLSMKLGAVVRARQGPMDKDERTEYVRIDLLSDGVAKEHLRGLLKKFLDQRIQFYESTDQAPIERINRDTAKLQDELWSEVRGQAAKQPTPVTAMVVSGMNDVLSLQGNTLAAWWNRIPIWSLGNDGHHRRLQQKDDR